MVYRVRLKRAFAWTGFRPLKDHLRSEWPYDEAGMRALLADPGRCACDRDDAQAMQPGELEREVEHIEDLLFARTKKPRDLEAYLRKNPTGRFATQARARLAPPPLSPGKGHSDAAVGLGDAGDEPVSVFISYSHHDRALYEDLRNHLTPLERNRLISPWSDQQIMPGDIWDERISEALETAELIIILITIHFINSRYCTGTELARALDLQKEGKARVIPIIGDSCHWKGERFATLQVLPPGGVPVTKWPNKAEAWTVVSEHIELAIVEMRKQRRRRKAP